MIQSPSRTFALSRRSFLGASAALAGTVAAGACTQIGTPASSAQAPEEPTDEALPASNPSGLPPVEVIALNRMAYGPRPGDIERVRTIGFAAYVEEQVRPDDSDDPVLHERLQAARLHIEHEGGGGYPAVNAQRPLQTLDKPLAELWKLVDWESDVEVPYAEMLRPAEEVVAATILRGVYSKWQLREVLVEFWHNHFHINIFSDDERITATWPIYDRDVIRTHALGNFRAFLEAVAQSTPMLYYLDNASSKASPANENYARELFELHTLGSMHYLNAEYQHWRDVPGALAGNPAGYIDDDVYEAARAFTGWTVADGREVGEDDLLPNTGAFHYYAGWHDPYQKRVLGTEFAPNQPALADGQRVLDLVAYHPGTARHICTKLCRRLVADQPPDSLVQQAVATWTNAQQAPDQIAQTVRTILLSPEFAATWGQKVKRPYESLLALLRATNATVQPGYELYELLAMYGYRLFAWPAPNGHPDTAAYWLSTNVMLGRWNLPLTVLSDWLDETRVDLLAEMPADVRTPRQIISFWMERLIGRPLEPQVMQHLLNALVHDLDPETPLDSFAAREEQNYLVGQVVAQVAMTPDFQWR